MKIVTDKNFKNEKIGIKAKNLFLLKKEGINVPNLFCIKSKDSLTDKIDKYIDENFKKGVKFAIRSSSSVEDSDELSFAGQFDTYLNIERKDLKEVIEKCRNPISKNVLAIYANGKNKIEINIIVQEMVNSQKSGVIFTSNPQGILNETVIVVGKGIGKNIVEDKIATTSYYYNRTDNVYYYEKQEGAILLTSDEVDKLIENVKKIENIFGKMLDIEFAIANNEIYILQVRKITTLDVNNPIVLDNSNIVESYPNITLPLTQSFIKEAYYQVFKGALFRITNSTEVLDKYSVVLRNTITVANGRVYYILNNFYNVLKLLPFEKNIIKIWQEMMGIDYKNIIWNKEIKINFSTKIKVIRSFFELLKSNSQEMHELEKYFLKIEDYYNKNYTKDLDNKSLIKLYEELKNMVIKKWYITIINDMYAFIYTYLVKRQLRKEKVEDYEIVSNKLISKIKNLESMKPLEGIINISKYVKENNILKDLEKLNTDNEVKKYLCSNTVDKKFKSEFINYIKNYGDRNIEELKLESKTFRTSPIILVKKIIEYSNDNNLDTYLSLNVDKDLDIKISSKLKKYLKNAEDGIRAREKSRLARSKLYGYMRSIVLSISENFVNEKIIENVDDIFYLYYNEIEDVINSKNIDLKSIISSRKNEYKMYEMLPSYTRIIFSSKIFNKKHENINNDVIKVNNDELIGIACSSGIVQGQVVVINSNNIQDVDVKGKIIVTKMTDPGWIYLIAQAIGLISEKGSLLSHSAIISRELQKPAIVGVKNVTKILKDNDYVRLDADKGVIEIIKK